MWRSKFHKTCAFVSVWILSLTSAAIGCRQATTANAYFVASFIVMVLGFVGLFMIALDRCVYVRVHQLGQSAQVAWTQDVAVETHQDLEICASCISIGCGCGSRCCQEEADQRWQCLALSDGSCTMVSNSAVSEPSSAALAYGPALPQALPSTVACTFLVFAVWAFAALCALTSVIATLVLYSCASSADDETSQLTKRNYLVYLMESVVFFAHLALLSYLIIIWHPQRRRPLGSTQVLPADPVSAQPDNSNEPSAPAAARGSLSVASALSSVSSDGGIGVRRDAVYGQEISTSRNHVSYSQSSQSLHSVPPVSPVMDAVDGI
jgi:hypothetical protein